TPSPVMPRARRGAFSRAGAGWLRAGCSGRAARADAVHFQRLRLRPEAERLRPLLEPGDHVEVLEFYRAVAAVADQERHRMLRRARVVAGDEGIHRLELVDEAVGEQEIERTIDRGRRGRAGALAAGVVAGADQFEQVVGLDRLAGVGDQAEHARADRRQPQAAFVAGALDRGHEAFGVVDVVLGIGAGVPRHGLMMVALAAGLKPLPRPGPRATLSRFAGEGPERSGRGNLRD